MKTKRAQIPEEFLLDTYDFPLPEESIAQHPSSCRGDDRLLVVNRQKQTFTDKHFADLPDLLPEHALLVVNNTRVLPARLFGQRSSGGRVEFLLLTPINVLQVHQEGSGVFQAEALGLLKSSKTPRIGEVLDFGDLQITVYARQGFGRTVVQLQWQGRLERIFEQQGHIPLPPYISRADTAADQDRYQTVYARNDRLGSVAAPTAGLHFTPELFAALEKKNITCAEISLYVGYGTFSPIRVDDIRKHTMHAEYAEVSEETAKRILKAKKNGHPVIAVGTTTARTLESMAKANTSCSAFAGWTDIFIYPGYRFQVVDHLITNFHLPRSSLLLMVSALAGKEHILRAYTHAINTGYRFFSYGDAMLIR